MEDEDGEARRSRQAWKNLADAGRLAECGPEEVVAACRRPDEIQDERLRGRLLEHLRSLARPFLMRFTNRDMPNGGLDAVDEIVSNMSVAILDPAAKDGAGYEAAFYKKLQQRLTDRHRAWRVQQARTEPLPLDEETGDTLEPADVAGLTPEEAAMAGNLIANLPEKFRRAFLLHRAGFPVSSKDECVSGMLGVTPKTADDWIKKAVALLREQLGSKP